MTEERNGYGEWGFSLVKPSGTSDEYWEAEVDHAYRQAATKLMGLVRESKTPVAIGPVREEWKPAIDPYYRAYDQMFVEQLVVRIPVIVVDVHPVQYCELTQKPLSEYKFLARLRYLFSGELR